MVRRSNTSGRIFNSPHIMTKIDDEEMHRDPQLAGWPNALTEKVFHGRKSHVLRGVGGSTQRVRDNAELRGALDVASVVT